MKDKISVVIPCYNTQEYLMRCFESIKEQSYGFENLEIIFVDDLSTDKTWSIIKTLKEKYPDNIVTIKLEKKGHSGGARNVGIDMCSGKYTTFVDADDWIHPKMFELLHEQMLKDEYDIVQSMAFMFSQEEPEVANISSFKIDSFNFDDVESRKKVIVGLTNDLNLTVWSKLYRTKFLKENHIRFIENCYFEDNHFTLICTLLANKFCKIHVPLYGYYNNLTGTIVSRLNPDRIRDLKFVIEKALKEIQMRKLDKTVGIDCKEELENFVFYKMYIETTTNLEIGYNAERNYYKDRILEILPNILENPYVKNYTKDSFLNKIDYLKK
jgi:poly(ribitol-phosphate) beta-N-acetylglucosaminyltransferase